MDKKNIKLLYVEDEFIIRETVGKMLNRLYSSVVLCDNGAAGFEAYNKEKPDLVITDIEMPVMNGAELVRKIKEIDSATPCVVLTAYKDPEKQAKFADKTLFKPVALDDLIAVIDSYGEKKAI